MLWMGIWVHPYTVMPVQVRGGGFWIIGVWASPNDVVMSWLKLQSPVDCIPHPYHMYTKCFSTLMKTMTRTTTKTIMTSTTRTTTRMAMMTMTTRTTTMTTMTTTTIMMMTKMMMMTMTIHHHASSPRALLHSSPLLPSFPSLHHCSVDCCF
jgi:hypothetical protein